MKIDVDKANLFIANLCMTSTELAKKAGITFQTLSRTMRGDKVKPATVGKIAKALEVKVEDII